MLCQDSPLCLADVPELLHFAAEHDLPRGGRRAGRGSRLLPGMPVLDPLDRDDGVHHTLPLRAHLLAQPALQHATQVLRHAGRHRRLLGQMLAQVLHRASNVARRAHRQPRLRPHSLPLAILHLLVPSRLLWTDTRLAALDLRDPAEVSGHVWSAGARDLDRACRLVELGPDVLWGVQHRHALPATRLCHVDDDPSLVSPLLLRQARGLHLRARTPRRARRPRDRGARRGISDPSRRYGVGGGAGRGDASHGRSQPPRQVHVSHHVAHLLVGAANASEIFRHGLGGEEREERRAGLGAHRADGAKAAEYPLCRHDGHESTCVRFRQNSVSGRCKGKRECKRECK
mmetsp:Transcript_36331/g.95797  ORF Transcript_36331/g.95797 Transcript_36331/m.95797 type:complete len:344 (-) Transcript_36331:2101-3132(-)